MQFLSHEYRKRAKLTKKLFGKDLKFHANF